jgi:hypothetical protein
MKIFITWDLLSIKELSTTTMWNSVVLYLSLMEENQCLPSLAAVYMVPGNFGCGSAVLAAITTLAPSLATFKATAFPIPRLAPVMNTV